MIQASSFSITFYIIALVVFAVFKAITDKAKKTDSSSNDRTKKAKPFTGGDELPETWKELFPKKVEMTSTKPAQKKVLKTNKPKTVSPKVFIEDAKDEGKSSLKDAPIVVDGTPETKDEEYAFNDIDDVRKAIIWSEIINKKYN